MSQQSSEPQQQNTQFQGTTVPELEAWLQQHGVNTSLYGVGASKPLELLLEEVAVGETILSALAGTASSSFLSSSSSSSSSPGSPQRTVSVVNVRIRNSTGQTLYEATQILPTGIGRPRNLPLSEKMLPSESWREAATRGIDEELGSILPPKAEVVLDESTYMKTEEMKESQSYPGLQTNRQGMHNVHGKLLARNGKYLTDYDAAMLLEGVYIEELGRLAAVAEPLVAVELSSGISNSTSPKNGKSSGASSNGRNRRGEIEDIIMQSAALRKAAEVFLSLSESEAEALVRAEEEEKARDSTVLDASGKNSTSSPCLFYLELNFQRKMIAAASGVENIDETIDGRSSLLALPPEALTGTATTSTAIPQTSSSISVSGQLRTLRCGFSIAITAAPVDTAAYTAKATRYSTMIIIVGLLQIALTLRQLEASSSNTAASRMSLLSLGQQAVQDAFLCLLHLTLAIMVDPLFNSFATAACVQFCLFGIFELRMLLLTWRARRRGLVDPWTMQRELSSLYARFYGTVLGSLVLCYNFRRYMHVMTLILHGFWIPQIIKSAKTDTRPPLLPIYVIGMSLTRLVLPLYLFACPTNLLKVAPSLAMCVALILLIGAQACVVLLQSLSGPKFGPRWFIPRKFLPAKYDYYRPFIHKGDIETGDAEDCVICMNPIDPQSCTGGGAGGGLNGAGATMVAPCDHRFHSQCLSRWMAVKMECPTCRRLLPPP
ncbi:hypothetical protein KSW81_006403 [Nannochloris sp. 'desiccata']|nr:hypothetical protein KSW81_006403 [Chlorella desiccata (nom. nud.)]